MRVNVLTTGLETFMKFPAELGPSISTISDTESLEGWDPAVAEYPSTESEFPWLSLLINGSEAKAGGGLPDNETGWFPKIFFSKPVCTKTGENKWKKLWLFQQVLTLWYFIFLS